MSKQASPAVEAFVGLLRAHAAVTRELSADLVAEHGLTINDYEVLLRLSRAVEGRMRRVDLAGEVLLTPSGVTRLLDGLEAAGLVERASCPDDRRVAWAVLTRPGRERLEAASASHLVAIDERFAAHFSEDEVGQLAGLLGRFGGAGAECSP